MSKESLYKRAALAIEKLAEEKDELEKEVSQLRSQVSHLEKVSSLTMKLYKMGSFPMEDFEDKFNEISSKTTEELQTFEKAAELIKNGSFNFGPSLGSLSDEPELGLTAEDRFIQSILDFN